MTIEYNDHLKDTTDDDILDWNGQVYKLGQVKGWLNSILENELIIAGTQKYLKEKDINYIPASIAYVIKGGIARTLKSNSPQGWVKGKLKFKLVLEFIPDEPEIPEYQSPLDEIRNHPSFSNTQ